MSVTKLKLSKILSEEFDIPLRVSKEIIDRFFKIKKNLIQQGDLKISGFGTYKKRITPSRIGRNPKTMEEFKINERLKVFFKSSYNIKKTIN